MKIEARRRALKAVGIYLVLVVIAFVIYLYLYKKTALAGLYLIILTFPWSILATTILEFLGLLNKLSVQLIILTSIFYALINSIILYYIVTRSNNKDRKKGTGCFNEKK